MTGILPANGVPPGETHNGNTTAQLALGCANQYYGPRCKPRLDPFQANSLISELLNAINGGDTAYDCDSLDNLQRALENYSKLHVLSVAREVPGGTPTYALPAGTPGQRIPIANGVINIPNTAPYSMPVSLTVALHSQVTSSSASARWIFGVRIYEDVAMTTTLTQCHFTALANGGGATQSIFDALSANVAFLDIPPGGRDLYYRFEGSASNAGVVSATETFARIMAYGAATPTGFTIDT